MRNLTSFWAKRPAIRALCLVLCASLALAFVPALGDQASVEDGLVYGQLNALFESGTGGVQKLQVLYDPAKDVLYLDPESLLGMLRDFDEKNRSGGCTVVAAGREYDFETGSNAATMRLGSLEARYALSAPVLYRDERHWIPANDLLYLANIDTLPICTDVDTQKCDPTIDFALFGDPAWTVPDVLNEIFEWEDGVRWMFNYQDDLGLSASDVQWKASEAALATGAHSLLSVDFTAISQLCLENFTGLANALSKASGKLFGTEVKTFASAYEKAYFRRFIEAMVSPSSVQKDALVDDWSAGCSFCGQYFDYLEKVVKLATGEPGADMPKDLGKLSGKLAEEFLAIEKGSIDKIVKPFEVAADYVGDVMDILQFGVSLSRAVDRMDHQDLLTLNAIQRFLDASKDDYRMDDVSRVSFEEAYKMVSDSVEGLGEDLTNAVFDTMAPYLAKQAGSSVLEGLTFFGEVFSEAWTGVEFVLKDVIPSQNALEAVQMTLYAMYYQVDSLRALSDCYKNQVLPNRYMKSESVQECGMLALNYLKACLVDTECALVVYEHDGNVNKTAAYKQLKLKAKRQADLIARLSDALHAMKRYDMYAGMGLTFYEDGPVVLDAPDCELLPLVLFAPHTAFSYDPFTAQAGRLTMYMVEGGHLLCDAGEGRLAWVHLTDGETGFRPAPVSGGISTRVKVLSLPNGRLLSEWDVATASGNGGVIRSEYTLYEAAFGEGFRAILSGMCEITGTGTRVGLSACALNGETCDGQALESAFAECGVSFAAASIAVGKGAQATGTLSHFTAEAEDSAVLLDLSSDHVAQLPPLFEELVDEFGIAE